MGRKPKDKRFYVTNKELLSEYDKYFETGVISPNMSRLIMLVVDRIATKGCFAGYTYIDDMKLSAYARIVEYIDRFDPERGKNVLAYWTAIVYNAFNVVLNDEKRLRRIKDELRIASEMDPSIAYDVNAEVMEIYDE